jgi:hypothetical protein
MIGKPWARLAGDSLTTTAESFTDRTYDKPVSQTKPGLTTQESRACKASGVETKCRVADGDSLGFEMKPVCF